MFVSFGLIMAIFLFFCVFGSFSRFLKLRLPLIVSPSEVRILLIDTEYSTFLMGILLSFFISN